MKVVISITVRCNKYFDQVNRREFCLSFRMILGIEKKLISGVYHARVGEASEYNLWLTGTWLKDLTAMSYSQPINCLPNLFFQIRIVKGEQSLSSV